MNIVEKIFHIKERKASLKNEILGGLVTFIAMCYILPLNSSILSSMGMNQAGVFAITAIVSFIVTMIMGVVANYPISLSAGMGLNAYLAYTLASTFPGDRWQPRMILLTVAGLLFFVFSLTPVRKIIIESIPKNVKYVISAALGAFICFVGLKGSGIIAADSETLVKFGSFADPAMIIAFLSVVLCLGLTFSKNKWLSQLAIPIAILFAAIAGVVTSTIMISNGSIVPVTNAQGVIEYHYAFGEGLKTNLPIAPWISKATFGMGGVEKVFAFGAFSGYSASEFGEDLVLVFTQPATYVAIFSLMFVNLFDTTATLIAVGEKTGIIDENGKMQNYNKAVLADATGALICGPMGTSTVTSFAESNIAVSMGAKTGLSACVTATLFLLSAFIYPVFSIFTAGSVTASALVAVGAIIVVNAVIGIDKSDMIACFTCFVGVMFSILTYSISNGIGVSLICYVVMMLFAKRHKEINLPIYVITGLFIVSYVLTTLMDVGVF